MSKAERIICAVIIALLVGGFMLLASAQDVYVSTHAEPVPDRAKVEKAVADWNQALGITLRLKGDTTEPCVDGAITFRTPTTEEFANAVGGLWFFTQGSMAACRPELNYTGAVILLNKLNFPIIQEIYTHELGHALGARHNTDSHGIMYPSVDSAHQIIESDIKLVKDCVVWMGSDGIWHIPSIVGYSITLAPVDGKWTVSQATEAAFTCPRNYKLSNGDFTFYQVTFGGGRFNVTLRGSAKDGFILYKAIPH